jgi:hypothetical protein
VVGEIFMRDNPFCSNFLVQRLEQLGLETLISPFSEWIEYSTYRYTRDSIWKGDRKGNLKSRIQNISHVVARIILRASGTQLIMIRSAVEGHAEACNAYVHAITMVILSAGYCCQPGFQRYFRSRKHTSVYLYARYSHYFRIRNVPS